MSTDIRPELSKKSKYYISKDRYYELKHFCLQYKDWKKFAEDMSYYNSLHFFGDARVGNNENDPTWKVAEKIYQLERKTDMVDWCAKEADSFLAKWIILGVTEGYSPDCLISKYDMPASKGTYYDRYRKFFWLLDQKRG